VRDGEQKVKVLKTRYSVRSDAALSTFDDAARQCKGCVMPDHCYYGHTMHECLALKAIANEQRRTVAYKEQHGRRSTTKLGVVHYEGAHAGLKCFRVVFRDGSHVFLSAAPYA